MSIDTIGMSIRRGIITQLNSRTINHTSSSERSRIRAFLDSFGMVVEWWGLVQWSPHFRDIDVNDSLLIRVVDRAEVEWVGVLTVVDVGPVIHECLLKADAVAVAFVETNRPCYDLSATSFGD